MRSTVKLRSIKHFLDGLFAENVHVISIGFEFTHDGKTCSNESVHGDKKILITATTNRNTTNGNNKNNILMSHLQTEEVKLR